MNRYELKQLIKLLILLMLADELIKTVGQLRAALKLVLNMLSKLAVQSVVKSAMGIALGLSQIGNAVEIAKFAGELAQVTKSGRRFAKYIANLNLPNRAKQYKWKLKNRLLRFLHIDPLLSLILDDAILNLFLEYLLQYIDRMHDNDLLQDLSSILRAWLNKAKLTSKDSSKVSSKVNLNRIIKLLGLNDKLSDTKKTTINNTKDDENVNVLFSKILKKKGDDYYLYMKHLSRLKNNKKYLSMFLTYMMNVIFSSPEMEIDAKEKKSITSLVRNTLAGVK